MTASLLLFAVALLALGGQLRRVRALDRSPRVALAAWQVVPVTAVVALTLAGLTLIVPVSSLSGDLAALLRACAYTLQAAYAAPTQLPGVLAGATLAAGTTLWAGGWILVEMTATRRERRRGRDALALVARHDESLDVSVVESDVPAAYCLPGRGERVVLTSAAVQALHADELAAVLAHERAHLRQRHHLAVGLARGLARAFPGVPLFAIAAEQTARLVELCADDAAAEQTDQVSVAGALVTLAGMRAPAAALAAAGGAGTDRVLRMLQPAGSLARGYVLAAGAALAALAAAPVLLALYPAFVAAAAEYCVMPPVER